MARRNVSVRQNLISPTEEQTTTAEAQYTYDDDQFDDAPRIEQRETDMNDFQSYATDKLGLENADVIEIDIEHTATKPIALWKQTLEMPRWLLVLLANLLIIIVAGTFCVVFAFAQSKVGFDQACLSNSDCNAYVGLRCTTGKCRCGDIQYWNSVQCVSQRTFNRSCTSQDQCDSLAKLLCMNVTIGSHTDSACGCSSYRYWTGAKCATRKSINETCTSSSECDMNRYLTCIGGRCNCNSTQFWSNMICEDKRTYGEECFSTYWCNNATQGLQCSTVLPTAGTCDCLSRQYWWAGNNTCQSQLPMNSTCTFDYQCLTNQSLYCSSNTNPPSCQCAQNYWFNSTRCTPTFVSGSICTNSIQCDSTRLLSCNLTASRCSCNESIYTWDGANCVSRRSIGGGCSSDSECRANQNLICATSGVWTGTCACPTNYYWNTSTSLCVIKKLWYQPCASSYECYDGGFLSCLPNAGLNRTVCDCSYTDYWTGFLNNTFSGYCTPKINYGVPSFACVSSYQCRDYNYITCIANVCDCNTFQYWDGTFCEPRLNYSYPCNSTTMCRNWAGGPNLQCLVAPSGSVQQCLCTPTQYFDYCADSCYSAKAWQQPCNTSTCYATAMCDQTKSLSCVNNICNCTNTQWWNSTCLAKGTYLAACVTGQNYQCQEYNLLSCSASQCQCGSVMYWSGTQCQPKRSYGGTCASTIECITAAGIGLSCITGQCRCSTGYNWNSVNLQCDLVG